VSDEVEFTKKKLKFCSAPFGNDDYDINNIKIHEQNMYSM